MNKLAVFTIAGEEFGIELNRVVEIIRPQKTTFLPNVPDFIDGVINLRGTVITVMDLRKRLNVKPSSSLEKIIVASMHGEKIGILVDTVKEIISIEDDQISPPPSVFKGLKAEYFRGIGKVEDRLIVILDLDSLLSSEEMISLEERKVKLSPDELSRVSFNDQKEEDKID